LSSRACWRQLLHRTISFWQEHGAGDVGCCRASSRRGSPGPGKGRKWYVRGIFAVMDGVQVAGSHVMSAFGGCGITVVVLDIVSKTVNCSQGVEILSLRRCDGDLILQYVLAVDLSGGCVLPEEGIVGESVR
jgi:hypothetical protein